MAKIFKYIYGIFPIVVICSCGFYRYSDQIKLTATVYVATIKNHVKTLSPDINFQITEKLKRKIDQDPYFKIIEDDSELTIEGAIKDLNISPFSIGANNVVYLNRVTLNINITRINNYDNKKNNKKNFEAFVDYDGKLNFGTVKDSIYNILSDRIVDEISDNLLLD